MQGGNLHSCRRALALPGIELSALIGVHQHSMFLRPGEVDHLDRSKTWYADERGSERLLIGMGTSLREH